MQLSTHSFRNNPTEFRIPRVQNLESYFKLGSNTLPLHFGIRPQLQPQGSLHKDKDM